MALTVTGGGKEKGGPCRWAAVLSRMGLFLIDLSPGARASELAKTSIVFPGDPFTYVALASDIRHFDGEGFRVRRIVSRMEPLAPIWAIMMVTEMVKRR